MNGIEINIQRMMLTAALTFGGVAVAQDAPPAATHVQAAEQDSDAGSDGFVSPPSSVFQSAWLGWESPFGPQANPQTSPKPVQNASRPRTEGSMVGYIDNPIVQSLIRVRFDDAFEDQFPDRSEFFYAKCACFHGLQTAVPAAYDPKSPGPGPGIPRAVNFQQLYLDLEYSPQRRFSVFVETPFRWLQPQNFQSSPFPAFSNQAGLGDVMAGFKVAAVASEATAVTFQMKIDFPTGDASKGLGTNHYSIEPSLLALHKFSDRFTMEGQLGDFHPIGGSAGVPTAGSEGFAGDVFFYGIGPSYKVYNGQTVKIAPVVELFGWHVVSGFQTQLGGAADGVATEVGGMNIVNLKIGTRIAIGPHSSFYLGFGQALTHDDWYKHIVRLEYRYTF